MQEFCTGAGGATLYLDCQAGIAGDMFVGALLDLAGQPGRDAVRAALASLNVPGFEVCVSRVAKSGIDCCDFDVVLDSEHDGHDHDMAYLHGEGGGGHGHVHEYECEHDHGHHNGHSHGRDHGHDREQVHHHDGHSHEHHHAHEHRGLPDILAIVDAAAITPAAKDFARRTFNILAQAEAKAHNVPADQVHFHEVGAVDSICDIVAAAVLVDLLHVTRAAVPVLVDGCGTIRCQHGIIPVPVPATLNVCTAHGLPLAPSTVLGELVTPTGAALVAALNPAFELPERYAVRAVGYGAGKRTYERPSLLRVLVIEELAAAGPAPSPALVADAPHTHETEAPQTITKLECDIDDCSSEVLAFAAERLRGAGAREVHWLPIFCKKDRPAFQLQVICANDDVERLQSIIFAETTTIGIRRQRMERTCLERSFRTVRTEWGPVRVKVVLLPDGSERLTPEYEDCAAIAREHDMSLQRVMAAVLAAATAR